MKLTVQRFDPTRDAAPYEQTFEVPDSEGLTVLDALMWLREHVDPELAFRFACRNANACKECVAVINGKKTYLCTYPGCGEVRVEPLPNKPLLRDLAVEL